MRAHIVKAILQRELKEVLRNPNTLVIVGMCIGINVMLSLTVGKAMWITGFGMCLSMIGFTLTSFLLVEEKEKKTLEALLVSPASNFEVLVGKFIFGWAVTCAVTLGFALGLHHDQVSVLHTLLVVPLGAYILVCFGIVLALLTPTQAILSGFGTIILMLLFMPEVLAPINIGIAYFARFIPTHHVIRIAEMGQFEIQDMVIEHSAMLVATTIVVTFWTLQFLGSASKQEGAKWRFSTKEKMWTGALILTLLASVVLFKPYQGVFSESEYVGERYQVRLPISNKDFNVEEVEFFGTFSVFFEAKENDKNVLYIKSNRKKKKDTWEKIVEKQTDEKKLKQDRNKKISVEEKGEINGVPYVLFDRSEGNSFHRYYMFMKNGFIYHWGVRSQHVDKEKMKSHWLTISKQII